MEKLFCILIVGFAVAFNSFSAPTSAEQLRSEFEAALKTKNTNAMLSLYNWEGVPDEKKSRMTNSVGWTVSRGLQNNSTVKILPLSPEEPVGMFGGGFRFFENIPIVGKFEFDLTTEILDLHDHQYYGKKGNYFYLPVLLKEKAPASIKALDIDISAQSVPRVIFTGSYIYTSNGKEIKKSIGGTNEFYTSVYGDYIKSCDVRRISDNGWIHIRIYEDTNCVFDSGMVETNDSISYEKKD